MLIGGARRPGNASLLRIADVTRGAAGLLGIGDEVMSAYAVITQIAGACVPVAAVPVVQAFRFPSLASAVFACTRFDFGARLATAVSLARRAGFENEVRTAFASIGIERKDIDAALFEASRGHESQRKRQHGPR